MASSYRKHHPLLPGINQSPKRKNPFPYKKFFQSIPKTSLPAAIFEPISPNRRQDNRNILCYNYIQLFPPQLDLAEIHATIKI